MIPERIYAALLLAFPRAFRRRYAGSMREIFRERYASAGKVGGGGRARFLAAAIRDVLVNASLERLAAFRRWLHFADASDRASHYQQTAQQRGRAMFWQSLRMDLRYALRMAVRTPVFTGLTVLALALGIGANSAIFSVVNAVLLRPLPFEDADRLVMVWNDNTREGIPSYPMSPANFLDVKAAVRTLDRMEMMFSFLTSPTLRTDAGTDQLSAAAIAPGMFELLGRRAALGRTLQPSDGPDVVVLSDGFWTRHFGGNPAVLGTQLILDEQPATVIGVMPPDFHFPLKSMLGPSGFSPAIEPDAWMVPDVTGPRFLQNGVPVRTPHYLSVLGRLAPGVTIAQAQEEVTAIAARLAEQYPEINRGLSARVVSLHDQAVARVRPALVLLLAAAGLVLLMACVNVANLLLARSAARQKEIAVRTALGAGRGRLASQMLAESVLLSAAGGALGLLVVHATVRLLVAMAPPELPRLDEIRPDLTIVLFTASVAIVAGLLMGIAPAAAAGRGDLQGVLKDTSRGLSGSRNARRWRGVLVVSEVALAVVLTVGAVLLIRSFTSLLAVDPGFKPENLLTLQIQVPRRFAEAAPRDALYAEIFARLDSLPGVEASGGTTRLPLGSTNVSSRLTVEGRNLTAAEMPEVEMRRAVHDYFRAMGMPLLGGRTFSPGDGPLAPPVAVVNQTMARRVWPDENPIGRRFKMGSNPQTPWMTVIGIVGDLRHAGLDVAPAPEFYIWYLQGSPVAPFLVVRTRNDPADLAERVRAELKSVEKDLAVYDMRAMEAVLAASVAERRFILELTVAFGLLALVLAAVGVYGVMALVVAERSQEMGIRLAVGARPIQVVTLVVRQGLILAAAGIAVGLAASLTLTPFMRGVLYGIAPADPVALATVPLLLLAVALLACAVPAVRAMRVDPVATLRSE